MRWSAALLTLALGGCARPDIGIISPAGKIASAEFHHMILVALVVMIVIVPLFVGLPWVMWRYRWGSKNAPYRPDWSFSWPLEILIWGVPVLIVGFLGWKLWDHTHQLDPYRSLGGKPVQVEVVGLDWKWLFIYPQQGIATVNELVIPQHRDISLRLTADGPMMSFIVPRLAGQIYAMGGMVTQLHLEADKTGNFYGRNTQYDGNGFAKQRFVVKSVDARGFRDWVAGAKGKPPLSLAAYDKLAQASVARKASVYGSVTPDLFARIIAKYNPSHAGPSTPGAGVSTK